MKKLNRFIRRLAERKNITYEQATKLHLGKDSENLKQHLTPDKKKSKKYRSDTLSKLKRKKKKHEHHDKWTYFYE